MRLCALMLLYLHETAQPCLPFFLPFLTNDAVMDGKHMMDLSFNGLGLCVAVGCFLKLGGVWRGPGSHLSMEDLSSAGKKNTHLIKSTSYRELRVHMYSFIVSFVNLMLNFKGFSVSCQDQSQGISLHK